MGNDQLDRHERATLRVLDHLDLAVLALALPLFIAAGFPLLGWAAGAGAYVSQYGVKALVEKRAKAAAAIRTAVGLTVGGMIARGWLVALAIFGVGLADSDAGLAAAILFLAAFTTGFTLRMAMRPFDPEPAANKGAGR